jgi:hypothetical protein
VRDQDFAAMRARHRLARLVGKWDEIYQGDATLSTQMERTRRWIHQLGIADHRAAGGQTFVQAFAAVYHEEL